MTTITDSRAARAGRLASWLAVVAVLAGCGDGRQTPRTAAVEQWSVTAWGDRFEVFPEVDALIAGTAATAHTHVTRLGRFAPLAEGSVSVVLSGPEGEEEFTAEAPVRPGVFAVEIRPAREGDFDLSFRIRVGADAEEVRGGRVRVGRPEAPGALLVAPAPKAGTDGDEPVGFLKEQQWRADFATDWVRSGSLPVRVSGIALVRPPAGGEATLSAPVDGVVRAPSGRSSWPHVGLAVEAGAPLFRINPLVASDRSLPTLEAESESLDTEFAAARARLERLEALLELDAVSRREVEEARTRADALAARAAAAARDLDAARSARQGGASSAGLVVRAPFAGELARVAAVPGMTVAAGEALGRLVGSDVAWIEAKLAPAGARRLAEAGVRGVVLRDPEHGAIRLEEDVRLVSIAPEIAPETGTVTVLLEVPRSAGPALGATLEAGILSAESRSGIVVPSTAVIDDGGVAVVYLQLSGESFVRQVVRVVERQGDRTLVERLVPGQRLVTRGGEAIRRASLMASGEAHGHVH